MILVGYYLACVLVFPAWLAVRMHRSARPAPPLTAVATARLMRAVYAILGLSTVALVLALLWWPWSIWSESEAGLLAIAALSNQGQPYYSGQGGIGGHALLYGPLTFLPYRLAFAVSNSMLLAKLAACAAAAAGLALILRAFGTIGDPRGRAIAVLALGGFALPHAPSLFVPKGDAWVLLYAALPLLTRDHRAHGWTVGLCAGLALSTKVPAVLAFLPYAVDAAARHGRRALWQCATAGALVALAAHATLGRGLIDYLELLKVAGHHPLTPQLALASAMTLLLPALLYAALLRHARPQPADFALIAATALMLVPAAKIGAGSYHLAPLMAPFAMRIGALWPRHDRGPLLRRSDAVFGVLLAVLTAVVQLDALRGFVERARGATKDIETVQAALEQLDGPYAVIPSHDGFRSLEPYLLVPSILAGAEAPVTIAALSDWALGGDSLPPRVADDLLDCRRTWLSAAELDQPWGAISIYWTLKHPEIRGEGIVGGSLFDASFRRRFAERYADAGRLGPFRIWRCRNSPGQGASRPLTDSIAR